MGLRSWLIALIVAASSGCSRVGYDDAFPGNGGDHDSAGDTLVAGDGESPLVTLTLNAPMPNPSQGQVGVPIELQLQNLTTEAIAIEEINLSFSRDEALFTVGLPSALPVSIPSGGTTLRAYLGIDAAIPMGQIEVNAEIGVAGPSLTGTIGPAATPVTLSIAAFDDCPLDSDADGLPDDIEAVLGSNTDDPDSDGDMLDDAVEIVDGVPVDSDGDGTPDFLDDDSDDDGLPDLLEAARGSDPTVADGGVGFSDLTVTDTSDDLDGGGAITEVSETGPTLSLREALTIANNRAGSDRVVVSAGVLGAGAVITTTQLHSAVSVLPEVTDADTFIDADGVTVAWDMTDPAMDGDDLLSVVANDFAVRGLTFDMTPSQVTFWNPRAALDIRNADGVVIASVSVRNTSEGSPVGTGINLDSVVSAHIYRLQIPDSTLDHGIDSWDSAAQVRRSTIDVEGTGVTFHFGGPCSVTDSRVASLLSDAVRIGAPGTTVKRNDITAPSMVGVKVFQEASHMVWNNVVHDTAEACLAVCNWTNCDGTTTSTDPFAADFQYNELLRCGTVPLLVEPTTQNGIQPPTILPMVAADSVSGMGVAGQSINVYSGAGNDVIFFLGTATVTTSTWTLSGFGLTSGDSVWATAHANGDTSAFAGPVLVP